MPAPPPPPPAYYPSPPGLLQAFSWLHTLPLPEYPYTEFGHLSKNVARAYALIRDIASSFSISLDTTAFLPSCNPDDDSAASWVSFCTCFGSGPHRVTAPPTTYV